MAVQVLLVDETNSQSTDLSVAQAMQKMGYGVTAVPSLTEAIRKIGATGFNLAVINQYSLDETSVPPLVKLNRFVSTLPLLVLTKQISVYAYREIGKLNNFMTLQKPFQESVLKGVMEKIATDKLIIPSVLPRFITDEPARIWVLGSGLHLTTRMKNYSAGGAFFQYRGISMKVGDRIQIGFDSHGSNHTKAESLRAKVRWIKHGDGPTSPMRGIGVQFEL